MAKPDITEAPVLMQRLFQRSEQIRPMREAQWSAIQEMFENGFSVSNPTGTRRIESQLLHQGVRSVVQKMKILDATLHSSTADETTEKVVTDGVSTVLEEGGYVSTMRDKFGVFYKIALFGDAFVRIGADKDDKYPIKFQNTSLLAVYIDPFATQMRSPTSEKDVDELVAVYRYSQAEAETLYPALAGKNIKGRIPRETTSVTDDEEITVQQDLEQEEDLIEIAHYYSRSQKRYAIIAGATLYVIEELIGDDYPFIKDKQAYIPFLHFMFDPSSEGFYNYGLGHILYRLAVLTRQLDNMGIDYGFQNVDPIRMVNVPKGEKSKFFNKLLLAKEAQANGRQGFVVNEYGVQDRPAGSVSVETFQSQALTTEWERLFQRLDLEIKRMGINLDSVARGSTVTATQIISEEENQDAFVKQVMEQNAGEFKFTWELTIEMIKEYISKNDKTIINSTTRVRLPNATFDFKGVTMGMLSEELKENDYFVRVNARSGTIPSNVMQLAKLSRSLSILSPEDPMFNIAREQFLRLNDMEVGADSLMGGQIQDAQKAEQSIPTETDELSARSKPSQPLAAIA